MGDIRTWPSHQGYICSHKHAVLHDNKALLVLVAATQSAATIMSDAHRSPPTAYACRLQVAVHTSICGTSCHEHVTCNCFCYLIRPKVLQFLSCDSNYWPRALVASDDSQGGLSTQSGFNNDPQTNSRCENDPQTNSGFENDAQTNSGCEIDPQRYLR